MVEKEYIILKRVDNNTIKLAKSLANIYFSKFETLDGSPTVNNNIIEPFEITGKFYNHRKFIEKFQLLLKHLLQKKPLLDQLEYL